MILSKFFPTKLKRGAYLCAVLIGESICLIHADEPTPTSPGNVVTLTPAPPSTPQIHGPGIFGVRLGSPFLYTIPATGDRPMTFSADGLPVGLKLDEKNGQITGTLTQPGTSQVTLHAKNSLGQVDRSFKIVVGDEIALTPPMGWNTYNCWANNISQEKVLHSARALVKAGLDQHGWTYINIDDGWQGARGGEFHGILADPKTFPDFKGMADEIHGMGLKLGIYSTPWVTSYAHFIGGSSENP
jgi:alpha-galactosidase